MRATRQCVWTPGVGSPSCGRNIATAGSQRHPRCVLCWSMPAPRYSASLWSDVKGMPRDSDPARNADDSGSRGVYSVIRIGPSRPRRLGFPCCSVRCWKRSAAASRCSNPRTERSPVIVFARIATYPHRAIDATRTAHGLAARPVDPATAERGLRLREIAAHGDDRSIPCRHRAGASAKAISRRGRSPAAARDRGLPGQRRAAKCRAGGPGADDDHIGPGVVWSIDAAHSFTPPAVNPSTSRRRTIGEEDHGQHHHYGRGERFSPFPAIELHEIDDRDRGRHRMRARENQRIEEIVPGVREAKHASRAESWRGERQRDAPERLKASSRRSHGLLERARQCGEERLHHPDHRARLNVR